MRGLLCWFGLHARATNRWGLPYLYCPRCGRRGSDVKG
jgi:hypothetical protein